MLVIETTFFSSKRIVLLVIIYFNILATKCSRQLWKAMVFRIIREKGEQEREGERKEYTSRLKYDIQ